MNEDVQQMILSCAACATKGSRRAKKGEMQKYQVGRPMERVVMDILGSLNQTARGIIYILQMEQSVPHPESGGQDDCR